MLGICGYAASLMRRHPLLPDLVFFALTVIGLAAILRLPSPGIGSALALMVGLVTWIVTLRVLTAPLLGEVAGDQTPDLRRRDFLIRSGWVVAGVAVLTVGGRFAGSGRRHAEQARRLLRLPVRHGEVPVGADIGVPGIQPWRTPNSDFYLIHTALAPPSISPPDWQLRIHGMVEKELTFSYQDLIDRQLTEAWITLCCVSNEVGGDLIGNAWWSGVLARELLAEAGVKPGADAVLQTSQDGWNCGTPLSALTDDRNAMLAVAMNGKPLPGGARLPGADGGARALRLRVRHQVAGRSRGDQVRRLPGLLDRAQLVGEGAGQDPCPASTCRGDGAQVKAGSVRIGGSAWAQHTGIEKVEYQLDGAAWAEADLGRVPQAGHVGAVVRQCRCRPRRSTDLVVRGHGQVRLHPDLGARRCRP